MRFLLIALLISSAALAQPSTYKQLRADFQKPPVAAHPWVFWYWMQAAVSREGITADLEAMKRVGIAGAYLMPIKGAANPPVYTPVAEQLSPEWWKLVKFALEEASRLKLKIAFHISDGFALAGGPWIKPEMSMQKVVSSSTRIEGGKLFSDTLARPPFLESYYKDIAVYAYRSKPLDNAVPIVTSSLKGIDASFLLNPSNQTNFKSEDSCWIQYEYSKPFTAKSLFIRSDGRNYYANRLLIAVSNDGVNFETVQQLQAPRHGWQDNDAGVTHSIGRITAKYFRFYYSKKGIEPGAEDLDAGKWKASLTLRYLGLSGEARIHQFEGKNGEVWRISKRTDKFQLFSADCIPVADCINISQYMDAAGTLRWNAPAGSWTVIRMGHTSTGHRNDTGGGGKGLECDKFNPDAIRLQFDGWFGEALKQAGPKLAKDVLQIMHVDSWECGSQNWSEDFALEFRKRRGYDMMPYLPAMAGVPLVNAEFSEKFLYDVRQTIADLVVEIFYKTFADLAHEKGCVFTAESVAPTMMSDGMAHYGEVDVPMGEFWLNSPTHDKPNDMLDAISGAHIYGKKIIQAEAFTEVRMAWDESPAMVKTLGDRNYALGVNKLVYHVFTHNPWMNKKPGMTLGDGVGLFFQRDQTWFGQAKAWVDYAKRSQALLQSGDPVNDIAVFTGEELPRRSVLPDRLFPSLRGLFGRERALSEEKRLRNEGAPLRQKPAGVTHSANMADAEDWTDPLKGYSYDSFNKDALLRLASSANGKVKMGGRIPYSLLVIPNGMQELPIAGMMSAPVARKLLTLASEGATIMLSGFHSVTPGLSADTANIKDTYIALEKSGKVGKGRIHVGGWNDLTLDELGITPDFISTEKAIASLDPKMIATSQAPGIAWNHRQGNDFDLYFFSNQQAKDRTFHLSLRTTGKSAELWNAVTGELNRADMKVIKGRSMIDVSLAANASIFIVIRSDGISTDQPLFIPKNASELDKPWSLHFDTSYGGPSTPVNTTKLFDWSKDSSAAIKYYSGSVKYRSTFSVSSLKKTWLDLGEVSNIATVFVNGVDCGTAWTYPFRVDISKVIKPGQNQLEILVTNTWANRMIGDHQPGAKPITFTTATYRLEGKPLLKAGLLGPVKLLQ